MDHEESDLLAEMRARGANRFGTHMALNGGFLSENEAAALQQISVAEVRQQIAENKILVVMAGSGPEFPRFQFDEDSKRVFPEIEALLSSASGDSHLSCIRFLLSQWHPPQDRETPMDKIRNGTLTSARLIELFDRRLEPGH